jgi:hypothetical protein
MDAYRQVSGQGVYCHEFECLPLCTTPLISSLIPNHHRQELMPYHYRGLRVVWTLGIQATCNKPRKQYLEGFKSGTEVSSSQLVSWTYKYWYAQLPTSDSLILTIT